MNSKKYTDKQSYFREYIILYRVNKTSGLFWLTLAFTKLHALRLQGGSVQLCESLGQPK